MTTPTSLTTELDQLARSSLPTELSALHLELTPLDARAWKKAALRQEELESKLPLGGPEQATARAQGGVLRGRSLPQLTSFTDQLVHTIMCGSSLPDAPWRKGASSS